MIYVYFLNFILIVKKDFPTVVFHFKPLQMTLTQLRIFHFAPRVLFYSAVLWKYKSNE